MQKQISLFDYMAELQQPRDQPEFLMIPETELVERISKGVGVPFEYSKDSNHYEYTNKKTKIRMYFYIGNYTCDTYAGDKEGDAYLGTDWWCKVEGQGRTFKKIDDAIAFFLHGIKRSNEINAKAV